VNSILSFETPECKIVGAIDIYSTKQAASDRKLYKTIDKHLDDLQQDAINYINSTSNNPDLLSKSLSPTTKSTLPALSRSLEQPVLSSSLEQPALTVTASAKATNVASSSTDNFPVLSSPPSSSSSPTNTNAKLKKSTIDSEVLKTISNSFSDSPFGPLHKPASRKAFAYLISILNYSHPDHDFSFLQPSDFRREGAPTYVINSFNNLLFASGIPVPTSIWECLDRHIGLKECDVYSHTPPESFLDDEPGTLWSYMWFFFNKKRKRVAYLNLTAIHHHRRRRSIDDYQRANSQSLFDEDPAQTKAKRRKSDAHQIEPYTREEEYDLTLTSSDSEYEEDNVVGDLELE
jgi:hypothetical protein